ncbi:sensor histidine kinase [Cognatishimia sp. SS12]|uniref:sensor histidine kinase n=1 Tax=Cognatishimia sp. SS12 TaxID=2979465 RepID=UPI00232CDA91|nr:sensor histidine kinase [Cognatishimia sp. SS12]
MTLAMLPLAFIAVYQTRVVLNDAHALSSSALLARTVASAAEERELIKNTLGVAEGLASILPETATERCRNVLDALVDEHPLVIGARVTDTDGETACRSTRQEADFSLSPIFEDVLGRSEPFVSLLPAINIPGQFITLVTQPISSDDEIEGFLTLSIPHSEANGALQVPETEAGLTLASINLEGDIIAASTGRENAQSFLPMDQPVTYLPIRMGQSFRATSRTGEDRFYAVVPMIDEALFLVGSWPSDTMPAEKQRLQVLTAISFPLLMWVAGVGVAMFGMQRIVTRHITELRSAMRRFALGERGGAQLAMSNPPIELEEAERAFNRMALLLSDAEAQRESDLQDKEVLLREVHHRVKNNLQHIASLVNLQARKTRSDEVRDFLTGLNRRIRGLAVLHRSLFNTPNTATVDAAALVEAVIADLRDSFGATDLAEISTDLDNTPLYPDQAIPLSLLTQELMTEVFGPDGQSAGDRGVSVSLREESDSTVLLSVTAPGATPPADPDPITQQLIRAFARQLDGKVETNSGASGYSYTVAFPRQG